MAAQLIWYSNENRIAIALLGSLISMRHNYRTDAKTWLQIYYGK